MAKAGRVSPTLWRQSIVWLFALAVLAVPLAMTPALQDSFTLPKVALIRALAGLAVVFWLLRLAGERAPHWAGSSADRPLVAFAGAIILATAFSTNRWLSTYGNYKRYEDVFTLLIYCLLVWIVVNNLQTKDVGRIVGFWLIGSSLVSIYALAQYFGFDFVTVGATDGRAVSTMGNAVFLGSWLVLSAPLAFNRWVDRLAKAGRGRRDAATRHMYLLSAMIITAAVAVTFSRAAWLGLVVAVPALFVFRRRAGMSGGSRLIIILLIGAMLFVGADYFRAPQARPTIAKRAASAVKFGEGTVKTRMLLWRTTIKLVPEKPLFGYGPDALGAVYDRALPTDFRKIEAAARIDKAHNDWLNIAASLGLFGLFSYLLILLTFYQSIWRGLSENFAGAPAARGDIAALAAGVTGYLVAAQFSFSQPEVSFFFWLAIGLCLAASRPPGFPAADSGTMQIQTPGRSGAWRVAAAGFSMLWAAWFYTFTLVPMAADYHFDRGVGAEIRGQTNLATREFRMAANQAAGRGIYQFTVARRLHLDSMAPTAGGGAPDFLLLREALGAYEAAEALEPTNPALYSSLGGLYTVAARWDRRYERLAIAAYERSLAINPYMPETYINRGVLQSQLGDTTGAVKSFRRALVLDPGNPIARKNLAVMRAR